MRATHPHVLTPTPDSQRKEKAHTMNRQALVVGASRGLGLVLVDELLSRDWSVVATTRGADSELRALAEASDGRLRLEPLEMTDADQLEALHERLVDHGLHHSLDLLFVNAAIDRGDLPVDEVPTAMFTEVMITNALSPLRVLERLHGLVAPGGTVAVMSSDQGSISRNTETGYELYKASKAALNQLVRSYANRHHDDGHTKLLIDPGHNQTRLGGPGAPLRPQDSILAVVDVLEAQAGASGLRFLDRHGDPVPW